jgi:7-keto-8-aminopelargonate synthetase-like enzyme
MSMRALRSAYLGGGAALHALRAHRQVDLIMGTFSKSFASLGGFVAGEKRCHQLHKIRPAPSCSRLPFRAERDAALAASRYHGT